VNTEVLIRVSDAEMDMNRDVGRQPRPKMWGAVAAALSWLAPRSTAEVRSRASRSIETPRRSVDRQLEPFRDLERFSSPWE
jgi:hypothetical protein